MERYRKASREVFDVLKKHCKLVEKASIDEAYCDITEEVNTIIENKQKEDPELPIVDLIKDRDSWSGLLLPNFDDDTNTIAISIDDIKLLIGARIVNDIRKAVYDEVGFTCSAGISNNKSFAKVIASKNKPNGQTILRNSAIPLLLTQIKLLDIPYIGKKIGEELQIRKIETPQDLQKYSKSELDKIFDEKTSQFLYNICRGIDNTEVKQKSIVKSIMASKRFSPISSFDSLENILEVLSIDLVKRMNTDQEEYNRIPKTLTIYYFTLQKYKSKSLSIPMPSQRTNTTNLVSFLIQTLKTKVGTQELFPCSGLSLKASNFTELSSKNAITSFFSATSNREVQFKIPEKTTSFSSTKKESSIEDSIEMFKCNECGKFIKMMDKKEHEDFHFAVKLSREIQTTSPKELNTSSPKSNTKSTSKRKYKGKSSAPKQRKLSNQPRITSFLK